MKKYYEVKAARFNDSEGKSVSMVTIARLHGTEENVKAWAKRWIDETMAKNYWWMAWSKNYDTKRISVEVNEVEVEEV